MTYPLDAIIDGQQEQLRTLSSRHVAAFSLCVSERLFPIYDSFAAEDNWGDSSVLREVVDSVWELLTIENCRDEDLQDKLQLVQDLTPDLEQFDSVVSALAVDVCICIDSAIRCCLMKSDVLVSAAEYGLSAIRKAESVKQTGCLDLGDTTDAIEFENAIEGNANIQREIEAQRSDLRQLQKEEALTRNTVENLRGRAKSMRIDVGEVLRGLVS